VLVSLDYGSPVRSLLLVALLTSTALAQTAPDKVLIDRLPDDSGDVAGLGGWKIQRKPDKTHCTGIAIVTTPGKKKLSADDQPLADVYALAFPTGLDFDPNPTHKAKREASFKKFNGFIEKMKKVSGDARKVYEGWLADDHRDAEAKIRAVARIVQIQVRIASLLARAEIPKDVRSGEFVDDKIEAFCEKLSEVAGPLAAQAEESRNVCAEKLALSPSTGWWTAVCTPP
jgi:hypothetical protein